MTPGATKISSVALLALPPPLLLEDEEEVPVVAAAPSLLCRHTHPAFSSTVHCSGDRSLGRDDVLQIVRMRKI
jgi:hypothetical protein